MSKILSAFNHVINPVVSYLIHLGIVALVGVAAKYGFHISVPVFPTSLGTFAGLAFIKMIVHNLGQAWHSGRLEAQIVSDAKGLVSHLFSQLSEDAGATAAAAAVTPPKAA